MMETNSNFAENPSGLMSSLDITNKELFPFLPYLYKDLWELGSVPSYKKELLKKNMLTTGRPKILDFGCAKGAELIQLRRNFEFEGLGVDIIPEFIEEAKFRCGLNECKDITFEVDDFKTNLNNYKDFKIVLYSYDTDLLGNIVDSLEALKSAFINNKGYVLFDNAVRKVEKATDLNKGFPSFKETKEFFDKANFSLMGYIMWDMRTFNRMKEFNTNCITGRAKELVVKHPEKSELFSSFIDAQHKETKLLENELTCITWLLKNG